MPYDEHTAQRVRRALAGRGGLLIRVGPESYPQLVRERHASPMKMGSRTLTGFVRVDPKGYRTDTAFEIRIARGLAYVARLPRRH